MRIAFVWDKKTNMCHGFLIHSGCGGDLMVLMFANLHRDPWFNSCYCLLIVLIGNVASLIEESRCETWAQNRIQIVQEKTF